jgi:hypothetical protein
MPSQRVLTVCVHKLICECARSAQESGGLDETMRAAAGAGSLRQL